MPNWSAKAMSWGGVRHDFGNLGRRTEVRGKEERCILVVGCCVLEVGLGGGLIVDTYGHLEPPAVWIGRVKARARDNRLRRSEKEKVGGTAMDPMYRELNQAKCFGKRERRRFEQSVFLFSLIFPHNITSPRWGCLFSSNFFFLFFFGLRLHFVCVGISGAYFPAALSTTRRSEGSHPNP